MSLEKKVFIICPVRDATDEEKEFLENYVSSLEQEGYKVHYPEKHTNQDDPIGLNICLQNKNAIQEADEVHIYFKPKSKGTLFDIGMTFMLEKPIKLINYEEIEPTPHKSFQNVLIELHKKYQK